jgi:hypothetical protein
MIHDLFINISYQLSYDVNCCIDYIDLCIVYFQIVLASFDATCTDENQCLSLLANSTCFDNKCVCAPDYHYVNNTCWRKVGKYFNNF